MSTMSIPAFHVSDQTIVEGKGSVQIHNRKDATHSGVFEIAVNVHFNPAGADEYPAGNVVIDSKLNDGLVARFDSTSIELVNSYGKVNPTFYITGRCIAREINKPEGFRFWVAIVNNGSPTHKDTPDIAGFAIHDKKGNRVAYGMGPVKGNFAGKAE